MRPTPKDTGFIKSFDGTRIYYEVRGHGAPIVLVYGIGCLMNHWLHQTHYLSKKYKVILFDYRSHHKSEIPKDLANLSLDALSQDIVLLLDHLDIAKAHFVGHSFGVQLLMRLYQRAPERFLSAVFINGFARNPLAGMFGNDMAAKFFYWFRGGFEKLPDTLASLWRMAIQNPLSVQLSALAGGFNLSLTSLKDIEIYARGISMMDLRSFLTLFENMLSYDGTPVLATIEIPVLVIAGKKDSVTPLAIQDEIHRTIPGSEYLLVPYGSHCTQLDMPDLVNLRIDQFIKDVGAAGTDAG